MSNYQGNFQLFLPPSQTQTIKPVRKFFEETKVLVQGVILGGKLSNSILRLYAPSRTHSTKPVQKVEMSLRGR